MIPALLFFFSRKRNLFRFTLFPLLFPVFAIVYVNHLTRPNTHQTRLALIDHNNAAPLRKALQGAMNIRLVEFNRPNDIQSAIEQDSMDAALILTPDFDEQIKKGKNPEATLVYDSDQDGTASGRVSKSFDQYVSGLRLQLLDSLHLKESQLIPATLRRNDAAEGFQRVFAKTSRDAAEGVFYLICLVFLCLFLACAYAAHRLFTFQRQQDKNPKTSFDLNTNLLVVAIIGSGCVGCLFVGMWLAAKMVASPETLDLMKLASNVIHLEYAGYVLGLLPALGLLCAALTGFLAHISTTVERALTKNLLALFVILFLMKGACPIQVSSSLVRTLIPFQNVVLVMRDYLMGFGNLTYWAVTQFVILLLAGLFYTLTRSYARP